MCIRDRRLGFVKEQAFSYEVEEENDQEMLEAVSYTHLDVYKRQA